jgi:hypothetical protein
MLRQYISVKKISCFFFISLMLFLCLNGCNNKQPEQKTKVSKAEETGTFLIDNFESQNGISAIGTRWRRFTDQVMGGVSTAKHEFTEIDGQKCVLLTGDVSLENNGGFIQVSLSLNEGWGSFDASEYKGLRLMVKGNVEKYHVHLKTGRTELPWQYFEAPFAAGSQWQVVEISFEDFEGRNISGKPDIDKLNRIGIVGSKKAFKAEIAVAHLELYK